MSQFFDKVYTHESTFDFNMSCFQKIQEECFIKSYLKNKNEGVEKIQNEMLQCVLNKVNIFEEINK